jgi:membrane glycosyltransferase
MVSEQRNPELDAFVKVVAEMREAQNIYFRTRGGLDEARKIERAVDKYIADYVQRNGPQRQMFGD